MIDRSNSIMGPDTKSEIENILQLIEDNQDKLKECPFCGKIPFLDEYEEDDGEYGGIRFVKNYVEIRCPCGITMRVIHKPEGVIRVVNRWNTRID